MTNSQQRLSMAVKLSKTIRLLKPYLNGLYGRQVRSINEYEKERKRIKHIFQSAKARCNDINHPEYKNYGGRGIKWLYKSIQDARASLGPCPKGYWLDRTNNNGHYEVGNNQWVTPLQSAHNKRPWSKNNVT